jgi:hypothetical protein
MFRCAGQASGGPLMSNVRPHVNPMFVNAALRGRGSKSKHAQALASTGITPCASFGLFLKNTLNRRVSAPQVHEKRQLSSLACRAGGCAGRPSAGGRFTVGCSRTEPNSSSLDRLRSTQANWPYEQTAGVPQSAGAFSTTSAPTLVNRASALSEA